MTESLNAGACYPDSRGADCGESGLAGHSRRPYLEGGPAGGVSSTMPASELAFNMLCCMHCCRMRLSSLVLCQQLKHACLASW